MPSRLTGFLAIVAAVVAAAALYLAIGGTGPEAAVTANATAGAPAAAAPVVVAQVDPAVMAEVNEIFDANEQQAINTMIAAYIAANPGFIRDYLITNPEVIREAVNELEARRINEEAARQAEAIAQNAELLTNSPRQAVIGNPQGDVTLVEFFDYNCTYCKRALDDMNRLVAEDPNLRIVLKEFPVLGQGSTEAAQVAAAVILIAPERYDAFHQLLLMSAAGATGEIAVQAAVQVGVDQTALLTAMTSNEVIATIEEAYVLAAALGLTGTPSYVIGNEVVVGAVGYDALRSRIQSMRQCGQTFC